MKQFKLNTKQVIINSSKQLFSTKGYKATTIRDIAKDAGVASSAIFYHFNNKEGVLLHIISNIKNDISTDLFTVLEGNIESSEELKIRLMLYIDRLLITGIENWETVKILVTESYELRNIQNINSFNYSMLTQLENFFKKAKNHKLLRNDISTSFLADQVMALIMDQILQWKTKKELEKIDFSIKKYRDEWVHSTIKLLLYGVLTPQN